MNSEHKERCFEKYGKTTFTNDFSEYIWKSTYKDKEDETIDDTFYRVAHTLAKIEEDPDYWTEKFYSVLVGFQATPGGRTLANARN